MRSLYSFWGLCSIFVYTLAKSQIPAEVLQNGKTGTDVVQSATNLLQSSGICSGAGNFIRNLAFVESHDGRDISGSTFQGGIWKIDSIRYSETTYYGIGSEQNRLLDRVKQEFNIVWNQTRWNNLTVPLYSGIAACLYLRLRTGNYTPTSLKDQAEIWSRFYHPGQPKEIFISRIRDLLTAPRFICKDGNVERDCTQDDFMLNPRISRWICPELKPIDLFHTNSLAMPIPPRINPCKYNRDNALQRQLKPYPGNKNKYIVCTTGIYYDVINIVDKVKFMT